MQTIIGIGNPGQEYENTYHNAGILAVSHLAKEYGTDEQNATWQTYKKLFAYIKEGDAVFVRSLLYMNESGRAVREAARLFGADPKDIMIAHDDSDLPIGSFKIVTGGGSAGHNGVQSIIDHLGSPEFSRIRIGIRHDAGPTRKKAIEFVLSPIRKEDREKLDEVFAEASKELQNRIHAAVE
jgi:PTH1 family peptidyl-tRNA hydrolase